MNFGLALCLLLGVSVSTSTAGAAEPTAYPLTPSYVDIVIVAPNGRMQKATLNPLRYQGQSSTVDSATVIHINKQDKTVNRFILTMSYDEARTPRIEIGLSGYQPNSAGFVDFPGDQSGIWTTLPAVEGRFRTFGKYRVEVAAIYDRGLIQAANPDVKTFRATPAQANCFGQQEFKACVADFEAGIVRPGIKDE